MERSLRSWMCAAVLVVAAIAVFVTPHASKAPDGLSHVAAEQGFATAQKASRTSGSPLAGYTVGHDLGAWGTRLAGVVGSVAVFAVMAGLASAMNLRRRERRIRA